MNLRFSVAAAAAYAPGITSPQAWQEWARKPWLPEGHEPPELPEIPAMMRRRLGPLARMVAQVAYRCQGDRSGTPVVFASRYGDAARSLGLLRSLATEGSVSPTDFGLSVHNAIGAQYSIARGDRSNFIAVASGVASVCAGTIEALALLEDGADEVTLVCYDAPLSGEYAIFSDEPPCSYAWAWCLRRPGAGNGPRFGLSAADAERSETRSSGGGLPYALDVYRFFLAGSGLLRRAVDGTVWEWRRDDPAS